MAARLSLSSFSNFFCLLLFCMIVLNLFRCRFLFSRVIRFRLFPQTIRATIPGGAMPSHKPLHFVALVEVYHHHHDACNIENINSQLTSTAASTRLAVAACLQPNHLTMSSCSINRKAAYRLAGLRVRYSRRQICAECRLP